LCWCFIIIIIILSVFPFPSSFLFSLLATSTRRALCVRIQQTQTPALGSWTRYDAFRISFSFSFSFSFFYSCQMILFHAFRISFSFSFSLSLPHLKVYYRLGPKLVCQGCYDNFQSKKWSLWFLWREDDDILDSVHLKMNEWKCL
jgi:hypothetical protein